MSSSKNKNKNTNKNNATKNYNKNANKNYKNNKKYNSSTKKNEGKEYNFLFILPLIMYVCIIPLIAYIHSYETGLVSYDWYTSVSDATDVFLYWKMVWIIITMVYAVVASVYIFFIKDEKVLWTKIFIPMAVYMLFCLISAFASVNRYYSFHGIYEQFEPVWVLLSYGVTVYYSALMVSSENNLKKIFKYFTIGISVMTILGFLQSIKLDFFRTSLGAWYMTHDASQKLKFAFEKGRPYLTLYNPNYVGFYAALMLPLLAVLFIDEKKLAKKILYGVLAAMLFIVLFASQSRAGMVAIVISALMLLIFLRKMIIKHLKVSLVVISAGVIAIVLGFIVMDNTSDHTISHRIKEMFNHKAESYSLKNIVTKDNYVEFYYKDDKLVIYLTKDSEGNDVFTLKDKDNNNVGSAALPSGGFKVTDERFNTFSYQMVKSEEEDGFNGFFVNINDGEIFEGGVNYFFTNEMLPGDDTIYYKGGGSSMFKLKKHTNNIPFLKNHYRFANMRGYMWARSISILKKYIFVGSGPDTFIIAFPNDDIVGMNNSGHYNEIITKPHCMYLQVAVQTGLISLIALIVLYIWYIIDTIKVFKKREITSFMELIGVGICASVIGYMINAITNDSSVCLAPIFYTLLGIGIGINYYLKKEDAKSDSVAKNTMEAEEKNGH